VSTLKCRAYIKRSIFLYKIRWGNTIKSAYQVANEFLKIQQENVKGKKCNAVSLRLQQKEERRKLYTDKKLGFWS